MSTTKTRSARRARRTTRSVFCAFALITGAGCTTTAEQQQTLDSLNARLDAVSVELAASREDMARFSQQNQAKAVELAAELGDQLLYLEAEVQDIPMAVTQAASVPESSSPVQCAPEKPSATVVTTGDKMVVGELEQVWVEPPGATMVARIDTGAQSSSLHAENIVEFERDGEDWVRFEMLLDEEPAQLERRVIRYVRVYQQADPVGTRRAVVELRIRLGNIQDTYEFTLADRSHLDNEMLLGRNFLTDVALVDVGREFVQPRVKPTRE